jgi:hypothetical protein
MVRLLLGTSQRLAISKMVQCVTWGCFDKEAQLEKVERPLRPKIETGVLADSKSSMVSVKQTTILEFFE